MEVCIFESLFLTVSLIVNAFAFNVDSFCLDTSSLSVLWNKYGTLRVHSVHKLILLMEMWAANQGVI